MKGIFTLLLVVLIAVSTFAQVPEKISYQAVVRNSANQLVCSHAIGMQISILQSSINGNSVYVERQLLITNSNGLVSLEIGSGTVVSGSFAAINWSNDTYYLKTEIDINGGSNYSIVGTSQLLSVAYALHAKTTDSLIGGIVETDPTFTNSQAVNITATHINSLDSLSGTNTGDQNLLQVLSDGNSAGNTTITNLANPINAQDAVTKNYVDSLKEQINELLLVTGLRVIDYDGNIYKTVVIGTQTWMAENLKVSHYPNGDTIPYIASNTDWLNLGDNNTDDAYCYHINNTSNPAIYDYLYTYAAAIADDWTRDNGYYQGVCPDGWHIPTDVEWSTLVNYLGGAAVAGNKMKEAGTSHWTSPNTGANNSSGFMALPSNYRGTNGSFGSNLGDINYWWSSTQYTGIRAYSRYVAYYNGSITRNYYEKNYGFSVRCIKD